MTKRVLKFLRDQVARFELEGPVVEFGSYRVPGQEELADIREYFAGLEFIGCDLRPGTGVDLVDDMEHSHFPAASVGTVVCLETLEHVRQPWLALQEAYRILKPGGALIVSIPFRMHIHNFPDDYWRITPSGLEALMRQAGFEDIETWDGGEELVDDIPFPLSSFGVARKHADDSGRAPVAGSFVIEPMDGYRSSAITRERHSVLKTSERADVPIIVVLYGREGHTRAMFEQLGRVTDGYFLVLVDNGFEDEGLVESLSPRVLIKNETNQGITKAVNQGLAECGDSPYIAVLHNDTMVFEEGWLDHVVDFMESRPDVGVVSLCGRHGIRQDGSLDLETTVFLQEKFPRSFKPTWRFTEVAAIDGFAFVMRNIGLQLDESLGIMHYYDIDLSMQYIEAGYRAYAVGIDCEHIATVDYSSRTDQGYLALVGGDDDDYFEAVRERFRRKWQHMLPIVRGYRDEAYAWSRIEELTEENSELKSHNRAVEADANAKTEEIYKAAAHIERVEGVLGELELRNKELERRLSSAQSAAAPWDEGEKGTTDVPDGPVRKFLYHLATEGASATARRVAQRIKKK